jgi:hypothetical protein
MRNVISLLAILLPATTTCIAATNIIDATHGAGAGSFELGTYSENSGNYMRLGMNSTTIVGWTVGGPDGIDWLSAPSNPAAEGAHAIDLAGVSHAMASSSGSISTTIPTVVGIDYLVSFVAYRLGSDPVTGRLTAGNLDQGFLAPSISDPSNPTYTAFQYAFTAQGSSTTLTFATTTSGGFGPVIDSVVVEAIPEPTTPVGFGLGLVGCALLRRRFR